MIPLIGLAVLAVVAVAVPAAGEEVTAEVQTWDGRSWRLAQPTLEIFYTILERPAAVTALPPPEAPGEAIPAPGAEGAVGFQAMLAPGVMPAAPSPRQRREVVTPWVTNRPWQVSPTRQGRTQTGAVTLHQQGVATQIPLAGIESLTFSRKPVVNSPFLPHVAATHFRYAATAVLTDGSRVEGDYVNLGTTVLRGLTAQGRVDIPWEQIQSIRFER